MSSTSRAAALALLGLLSACPGGAGSKAGSGEGGQATAAPSGPVTLSILGTNDLHGRIRYLPILAGYVSNLRALRARDGGGVLLLDGGDLFQGTLESNLNEGASVVTAYNAMGYLAAAVGNHEFDYGPVGPDVVATKRGQDPRGALRARAREAKFPMLMANVLEVSTRRAPDWDNVRASIVRRVAGVDVGIIGITTKATPYTTMPANFIGLQMAPLAARVAAEAKILRGRGATIVIVVAHAGGSCHKLTDPDELTSCDASAEIFAVARALEPGMVDVIVAGHTHAGVAHRVNGVAIIESFAYGRAFGRIDVVVDRTARVVKEVMIYPTQPLCTTFKAHPEACETHPYAGAPVTPVAAIKRLIAPAVASAKHLREERLGVEVVATIKRHHDLESALGNLFTDLMRAARPDADVAITNGGGLRDDIAAGPLTYGRLYEANPFDNRFATIKMSGAQLVEVMTRNLLGRGGIFSISGARMVARCNGPTLEVVMYRSSGARIRDHESITVLTSDFLASGGDGAFSKLPRSSISVESGKPIRDFMADVLRRRGGTLGGNDPALVNPAQPRLTFPTPRPVRCQSAGAAR